jgi:hypothetical protein
MFTAEQKRALIDALRELPTQLEALVVDLTDSQLESQFITGEWSVAQNVHHLADSHMNAYIRTKLLLTQDNPTVIPYDQDVWATLPDVFGTRVELSLAIIRGLHARWTELFEQLSDEQFARTGMHPEYGVITVQGQLETYAEHGREHLDQITRTLAAQPA